MEDLLPNLLPPVRTQLGSARAHDGVGGGDVCLLSSVVAKVSAIILSVSRIEKEGWRLDYNVLALIKLRLQNLAMIFHALHISLPVRRFDIRIHTRNGGVDVPISENVGRHDELDLILCMRWYL